MSIGWSNRLVMKNSMTRIDAGRWSIGWLKLSVNDIVVKLGGRLFTGLLNLKSNFTSVSKGGRFHVFESRLSSLNVVNEGGRLGNTL